MFRKILKGIIGDTIGERREETLRLGKSGDPDVVDELERRLYDSEYIISQAALDALRDFGDNYDLALGQKIKADKTKKGAAWLEFYNNASLGQDVRTTRIVPILLRAQADVSCPMRLEVTILLSLFYEWSEEVLPALIKALDDPDADVRNFAAEAHKEIGPAAQDSIPALLGQTLSYMGAQK